MKKLYVFTLSTLKNINNYLQNLEEGSKVVIFNTHLKLLISENEKKGEIIRPILRNEAYLSIDIFDYTSFYEENISIALSCIKRKYKDYDIYIITQNVSEMLTAFYMDIKVFNYSKAIESAEKGAKINTKNILLDTSYLANMVDFSLFENATIRKHIPFFVLEELININNTTQFFNLIPFLNERDKYNITIIKEYSIPYSKEIVSEPDLFHILYILNMPNQKDFTLMTCDLQLIMEAKINKITTSMPIDIIFRKNNIVLNNKNISSTISDNLTIDIVCIKGAFYIYKNSTIDKVFQDLVTQRGKIQKKISGINYISVKERDYIKFSDGKIYQVVSLTDKHNLKEVKL